MQAKAAGQAWADTFHRLSAEEQRAIILRAVTGTMRSNARRAGHPEPIILEANVKPLPGGGYVLDDSKPMVPLREEWGGDGRTPEPVTPVPDPKGAKAAADKIKAALPMSEPPKRRAQR